MPLPTTRKRSAQSAGSSVLTRTLTRTKASKNIPFLLEKKIPAGRYKATIISVSEAKTRNGDDAVDVCYELIADDGSKLEAKERLGWDGFAFEQLVEHLFDSGLFAAGSTIRDAVGICEAVTVEYAYAGALGSFKNRQPWQEKLDKDTRTKSSAKAATKVSALDDDEDDEDVDFDDDLDDLLDDEDDE